MSEDVIVRVEGLEPNEVALTRLAASLTDLRLFWPLVVPVFIRWMAEQFATEGDWGGEHWAPLSPDYAARKLVRYPGRGILYATGDLRRAASQPKREATPDRLVLTIDDSGALHGAAFPRAVAGYHQEGTDRMPARPLIPPELPESARGDLDRIAEEYVDDLTRRLGLTR